MPFRSETEQLREQIRRTEADAGELLEEKLDLERRVGLLRRRSTWVVSLVTAVLAASLFGAAAGALEASKSTARRRAIRAGAAAMDFDREQIKLYECNRTEARVLEDLAECRHQLAAQQAEATPPSDSTCRCVAGDPLCSCPFDRGAAALALDAQRAAVHGCLGSPRVVSFHAKLQFSPLGTVETVNLEVDSELTDRERTCMKTVLQRAKVPPFEGGPVVVGKSFITGPLP